MTLKEDVECVGSLLIPSKDIQELSDISHQSQQPWAAMREERNECVGSLLVHSKDVQEVSKGSPVSALPKRKTTTVGTLFVSPDELRSPSSPSEQHDNVEPSHISSIRRRVTARMTGPAPKDEEADTWAD